MPPPVWLFRFLFKIYFKHPPQTPPPFADATSASILKTAPGLADRCLIYLNHAPSFGYSCSTYVKRTLVWRFRFIIYLKHAPSSGDFIIYLSHGPSFGDCGSRYILKTSPCFAILLYRISQTRTLIWRCYFIIYLKHGPSFGDSGSRYILYTPLVWRCYFIIYLKNAPSLGDSGSSDI